MSSVRVRMYRQGLGDCFLLTFPCPAGRSHVLIDCGVLKGSIEATKKITEVAENILHETDGRLDALVVTHQHWDHVSGFLQASEVFGRLSVSEVWLAWTEDPFDNLARSLAERKGTALAALNGVVEHLTARTANAAQGANQRLNGLMEFYGIRGSSGQMTTTRAMEWARRREGATVRYFKPGIEPIMIPGVQDARVYVLGPPRDQQMLRKNDPKAHAGEGYELADLTGADRGFLAAVSSLQSEPVAQWGKPFDEWFRVTELEAWYDEFFVDHYGFEGEDEDELGWRRIETDWLGVADRLALQLDSHTNNTSLALAFELAPSGKVMLFPGDAQTGNWLSWSNCTWRLREGANTRTVNSIDLLARTVLYKVGHHGSHNGTMREHGLELMSHPELTALLSASRETAKKMGWQMPFESLYRRLQERTKGRILDLDLGVPAQPPSGLSSREWERFKACTRETPEWIDYFVEM